MILFVQHVLLIILINVKQYILSKKQGFMVLAYPLCYWIIKSLIMNVLIF